MGQAGGSAREINLAVCSPRTTIQMSVLCTEEPRILNQGDKEPSQRGFKLASLNINKLTTHIDELRIFLAHNEIDILSKTKLKLS